LITILVEQLIGDNKSTQLYCKRITKFTHISISTLKKGDSIL